MYIKWLKLVIREVYKMVEIHYTRCVQNGCRIWQTAEENPYFSSRRKCNWCTV